MATVARFADELSSSPAATTRLPAAEMGLLVGERDRRLSAMVAAKNQAIAELGLLDQPATSLLPATELRLAAGADLTLKPLSELMLRSPAASLVLEAGAALTLEPGSALIVSDIGKGLEWLTQPLGGNEIGLLYKSAATLADTISVQYEHPLRNFMLAADDFVRPVQEATIRLAESMQPAWDEVKLWGQTLREQPSSLSRLAGLGEWDAVNRLYERANYPIIGLPNVAEQITGALQGWQAPAVHVTRAAILVEVEPLTKLPERRPGSQPPPQNGNFGIAPAQPGQPVDWQQALADALRAGLAKPEHIVQWLLQQDRGSQQPPLWADVELIALDYERNGHRYDNLAAFAGKHRMHRATVDRYLKMYEAATGKQVRPGQGRNRKASRR